MNPYVQIAVTIAGGALVQWTIVAFWAGGLNQRVGDVVHDVKDLKVAQGEAVKQLTNHERRISHIEGRKGIPLEGE